MKSSNYLFVFFLFSLFTACSESSTENTYLNVDPSVITIPAEGGRAVVQVSSNTSWTITSDQPDIWISPNSGTGDREVQVSIGKSKSAKQTEIRLVVKSQDGSIVRNVNVQQEGIFLSGATLTVTNHGNMFPFAGTAGDVDSLMILSNLPWQVKGPEWIEAYNGSRWVALSPDRATVQGGVLVNEGTQTATLLLRTAKKNDQEESLVDKIILSPTYDNIGSPLEIIIQQLGKHQVSPNMVITLASELATDWKCGSEVDYFIYYLSDRVFSDDELTTEIISKWDVSKPNYINGWDELKENTLYYIYTIGVDKNNNYVGSRYTAYSTQTSQNQPIATISNVSYANSKWSWSVKRNSFCEGFVQWKMTNSDLFDYNTGILAWLLNDILHDEESQKDMLYYHSDISDSWETPYHIQLLTWGLGANTNRMSNVLDRYRSKDHYESASRGNYTTSLPKGQSVKKDIDSFKKSLIRIN